MWGSRAMHDLQEERNLLERRIDGGNGEDQLAFRTGRPPPCHRTPWRVSEGVVQTVHYGHRDRCAPDLLTTQRGGHGAGCD